MIINFLIIIQAKMSFTILKNADLRRADLSHVTMVGAKLEGSKLAGANLSSAIMVSQSLIDIIGNCETRDARSQT